MEQIVVELQKEIDKTKFMALYIKQEIGHQELRDDLMSMTEFNDIIASLYSDLSANSDYLRGLQFALEIIRKNMEIS